jgi:hypothetical protein
MVDHRVIPPESRVLFSKSMQAVRASRDNPLGSDFVEQLDIRAGQLVE